MPMNNNQYAMLASKIGFKEEGMSYQDFTTGFEGTQLADAHVSWLQWGLMAPQVFLSSDTTLLM